MIGGMARAIDQERFGWFASPQWELVPGQPLRLASIAKSCGVCTVATELLDKAGIPWREVFIGGGMAAIGAAVSAGLAIAPLANSIAPVGTLDVGHRYGLPRLPNSDVILHSTVTDPVSQEALKMLAAAFRSRYASVSTAGTRQHRPPIHSQKRNLVSSASAAKAVSSPQGR
jgi:DNA-binding transcriptional LysR family regulator